MFPRRLGSAAPRTESVRGAHADRSPPSHRPSRRSDSCRAPELPSGPAPRLARCASKDRRFLPSSAGPAMGRSNPPFHPPPQFQRSVPWHCCSVQNAQAPTRNPPGSPRGFPASLKTRQMIHPAPRRLPGATTVPRHRAPADQRNPESVACRPRARTTMPPAGDHWGRRPDRARPSSTRGGAPPNANPDDWLAGTRPCSPEGCRRASAIAAS